MIFFAVLAWAFLYWWDVSKEGCIVFMTQKLANMAASMIRCFVSDESTVTLIVGASSQLEVCGLLYWTCSHYVVRLDVNAMASYFVFSQFHKELVQRVVLDPSCLAFQEFTWETVNI